MFHKWMFLLVAILFRTLMFGGNGDLLGTGPVTKDTVRQVVDYSFVERLSERQLIVLIDSLSDEQTIPCDLVSKINNLIAERERLNSKNDFSSFSIYPAEDVYGKWDTRNLFPYSSELSKHDTSLYLTLAGDHIGSYVQPAEGIITSAFGWRDSAQHQGVDIELKRGEAVSCAFDGMVRVAMRTSGGYGNVVIVRHNNGLETLYGHLYKIKVKPGDFVYAGQTIGLGGSTGHSTGPHLHFETRYKGVPINPKYFISFDEHKLISTSVQLKKTRWGYAAFATDTNVYTVQKGDNLYELSRQFVTTVALLKELNGFTHYPRLKAGDKLIVRKQDGKF
jgi:murein DD-endopeptidase MepM/ murein hydrolase activator NlpD